MYCGFVKPRLLSTPPKNNQVILSERRPGDEVDSLFNSRSLVGLLTEYRGVRRDVWEGLNGGWFLKHLTEDERFPHSPSRVEILRKFTPPRNDDNYYGQRLRAFFIPPFTGNYTFFATCDSECVVYLSFDESPENKKEVLKIDQGHRTTYDQWDR